MPERQTVSIEEERQAALNADFADWYRDRKGEIETCKFVRDVTELRDMVVPNLSDAQAKEFNALCDARQRAILDATRKTKKP